MSKNPDSQIKKREPKCIALLKLYWKEIIFEISIVVFLVVLLGYLHISFVHVIDGSLIAIILALPVTVYNWMSRKREKFFNDNIELLVSINKEASDNDELIDLRLSQINYIYENKIKSAEEKKLEQTIVNTVSRLVLNGISLKDEIRREDVNEIYKRLNIMNKDENMPKETTLQTKFNVIDELFIRNKNPLKIKHGDDELNVYLNYSEGENIEVNLNDKIIGNKQWCLIANSTFNIKDKDRLDELQHFSIYDSEIKFDNPLKEDDYKILKGDETFQYIIKKFDYCGNTFDESFKRFMDDESLESLELKAELVWSRHLKVSDRKTYREEIRSKYKGSFIKFSRSYANESEPRTRAGWFCIPEAIYEKIYNEDKYKDFFFVINANPDIEGQSEGICIHFDRETMKKYFDKKEGDSFAVNKDKTGNKLYQFYLYYEADKKYLQDNRVKNGEPLKIKLIS